MNTDEFEGHTPAPWKIELFPELYAVRETYYDEDLKLIAAAPDLLAEVKRLREAVTQYSEKDAWYVAEVKRLRSDLEINYQARRELEFETLEQQVLIYKLMGEEE